MFTNQIFYHQTIKKLIVAFSSLFTNIYITDSDSVNHKIPILFTTAQKIMMRYKESYKGKQIKLPTMSFILSNIEFDPDRQKNKFNKIYYQNPDTGNSYNYSYQPVAYNFYITLSIWTKYMEHFFQILEQISANFKPNINTNIKIMNNTEFETTRDIPIILQNINFDWNNDLDENNDRVLKADLNFLLKGELYPYINTNQSPISSIILDITDYDTEKVYREITIEE